MTRVSWRAGTARVSCEKQKDSAPLFSTSYQTRKIARQSGQEASGGIVHKTAQKRKYGATRCANQSGTNTYFGANGPGGKENRAVGEQSRIVSNRVVRCC